tara:strand:+ start:3846 stop:4127 length:282 start_codon:yes stop_codon:yes gene_type:complete
MLEPKAKIARISRMQIAEGEAGPLELRANVVQKSKPQLVAASPSKPKAKVVQRSEAQVAEGEAGPTKPEAVAHITPQVEIVPKPWRAQEARIY